MANASDSYPSLPLPFCGSKSAGEGRGQGRAGGAQRQAAWQGRRAATQLSRRGQPRLNASNATRRRLDGPLLLDSTLRAPSLPSGGPSERRDESGSRLTTTPVELMYIWMGRVGLSYCSAGRQRRGEGQETSAAARGCSRAPASALCSSMARSSQQAYQRASHAAKNPAQRPAPPSSTPAGTASLPARAQSPQAQATCPARQAGGRGERMRRAR